MSTATPMRAGRREVIYLDRPKYSEKLTARQRRRLQHKRNHAAAPFGKKAKGE